MADYRNLPFYFGFGGLNLVASPEKLAPGQYTYFKNVRYRKEGVLEARPGTEDFTPLITINAGTSDTHTVYPTLWNIGKATKTHYIGKIISTGTTEVLGYLTIHATGSGSNNATGYKTFINGVPVVAKTSTTGVWPAFSPVGYSVIRTVAKTGIPIVLVDGAYYIILKNCNLATATIYLSNYNYGSASVPALPLFYAYNLGITAPVAAPTVGNSGTGITGTNYIHAYSYQSSVTGFESTLSPSSSPLSVTNKQIDLSAIAVPTDPQIDTIRIWRKGGTLASSWRLVGTIARGITVFTDNFADSTIAVAEAFDTNTIAPFSTISSEGAALTRQTFNYAWGPFLGRYHFWVGDPVKKGYVYWNKSGDISRYDPLTSVTSVTDPGEELQNGFLFASLPFVFSKLNLYGLDFGGSDALPEFTPRLIPIGVGLAGKWAFAVGSNAVYFLGRDGIYATDCQPGTPVSLTEDRLKPIFQGATVNGIPPIDWTYADSFRMAATPTELHFFYLSTSGAEQVHLVLDLKRGAWTQWTSNKYASAYFDEGYPSPRVIFGTSAIEGVDKLIYSMDDSRPTSGTESFPVKVRTNSVDSQIPLTFKEYGVVQFDANLASTFIAVTPYYNSENTAGSLFYIGRNTGDTRKDYSYTLNDYYARSLAFDFAWTETSNSHPILYQGNLLFREDEEQLIHWEMPETALGNGGWFHLKDAYICLRSTVPSILTVIIDGTTTDYYTIPSTSGNKLRQYVEFKPRRGKVYRFKLDSADPSAGGSDTPNPAPFRLYGEESLVRGKPWITGATYAEITPFGPVGYAQYRRTEGGT